MKGIQGLIVAAGLGVLGAVFNYFYLASKAREIEMVSFIGIKPDVRISRGDRLLPDHLVEVGIPKNAVGELKKFAFLYGELGNVENRVTWRELSDCSLLLRSDIKTPPPELELGKEDTAMCIPVDSRAFVPSLITPGDMVSFKVPIPGGTPRVPTDLGIRPKPEEHDMPTPAAPTGSETIGPFRVLSVGNRLGDAEVMRTAKIPQMQENVLTIRVSKSMAGESERAEKLWTRLQAVNFRQVGIILHGKP